MKRAHYIVASLCFSLFAITMNAGEATKASPIKQESNEIKVTQEQKDKYPLKAVHAKLSFKCVFCHENQGTEPENFKEVQEKTCLQCHGSKEKLADRLGFIGKSNPHNSIHDGTRLTCDECHFEHKESRNMCVECHEKEVQTNMWMRKIP